MKKRARTEKKVKDAHALDFLLLIAAYLKEHGWDVAVIGGTAVRQPVGAAKYNFEFVVGFTGKKRTGK